MSEAQHDKGVGLRHHVEIKLRVLGSLGLGF